MSTVIGLVNTANIAAGAVTPVQMQRNATAGNLLVSQGSGSDVAYQPVSGDATITSGGVLTVANNAITPAKQTTAARTKWLRVRLRKAPVLTGSNQTLNAYVFTPTQAGTIVSARIISNNPTSGSTASDNWGFTIRNLTTGNNLASVPTTTNGGELAGDTPKALSVNQNQTFSANDQIGMQYVVSDSGSAGPTNLNAADIDVEIEYTI